MPHNKPSIVLEVLPAGFGDCLLLSCPIAAGTWRLLVDTGPDEAYPALRQRLLKLPTGADGRRHIDLFVVSHIDHDHIGGAAQLLNDTELKLSFGDIWFNAPPRPATRGVAEGEHLAQLLGATRRPLPWNAAFAGQPVTTPAAGGGIELSAKGLPTITLLSPTPERLQDLYRTWAEELRRFARKEREPVEPPVPATRGLAHDLEDLARRPTPLDRAVANGSSIAFVLEHRGASVLLGADAFASVLQPALQALAQRRGQRTLRLDAVKLSHHCSSANLTSELLAAAPAQHYIISTNNTHFGHPDDEALARIIVGGHRPTLWFNYDTPHNRRWTTAALCARYGHSARYPDGAAGVTLALP